MITQRDDDYLICKEYKERIDQKSKEFPDFITFQHPNKNYYFAWVNNDEIILRSEAYPDEEKMIKGIQAILKNRAMIERFSVEENHGVHFLVLWGGGNHQTHAGGFESHNEIGRSCPKKSRQEIYDLLAFKGADFASAIAPVGIAASSAIMAAAKASATASLVDKDKPGSVSYVKDSGKDKAGATVGGGFKWWYLLPLLLIPLFFWMKGCDKSTDASSTMQNEVSTSTTGDMAAATGGSADTAANMTANGGQDTIVSNAASTPAGVAPDCGLNWILFDFDQYSITSIANQELAVMAKILKENATYTASLSAHTDARGSNEYNDQLSLNRANAAKNVLISMGIDAARIKTSASSEADPIATNTDDDSGRKFNRRVELRVFDANNVEICKSIPPDVPGSLQSK